MGRAKRRLELLSNKKERFRTFERRLKGLKKQVHELKTLCDIEVCLIVDNVPILEKDNNHPTETLQYWPSDFEIVSKLITCHRNQPADDYSTRCNLATFYLAQNKKIEKEIIELKKNKNDNYPTWDDSYNLLSKVDLEEFGGLIGQKIQFLKTRIDTMKNNCSMVNNSFHESELLRDNNYIQKQIASRNKLFVPSPTYVIQHENGNSSDSLENQVYLKNLVSDSLIENDYTRLEDMYSSEFISGLMDSPINTDSFDFLIPDTGSYFDMDTDVASQFSEDSKTYNAVFGRRISDEFFHLLGQ